MSYQPYLYTLARGILIIAGLSIVALSGISSDWSSALSNRFGGSMAYVVPAYWLLICSGMLVILFPLTVAEDHVARARDSEPGEETPVWDWVQSLGTELLIMMMLGCLTSAVMLWQPAYWWMMLAALWMGYHLAIPLLQDMALQAGEDEEGQDNRRPELVKEFASALAVAGITVDDVRVSPDDDELPYLPPDVYLVTRDSKTTVFIPTSWVAQWTLPELIAVVLHKAAMEQRAVRIQFIVLRLMQAMAGFGGFALLFTLLHPIGLVAKPGDVTTIPYLLIWLIVSLSALRPVEFVMTKRCIIQSDHRVLEWMKTADGIIAALERARSDYPEEKPSPRWVELFFMSTPSLNGRIDRLKGNAANTH